MKKLTIIWLFLILPFLSISQKVTVKSKVNISDTQTYEEALDKALADAKEQALRQAGVKENIHSFTSLSVLEDNESFEEVFNSEIFSDIGGTITKWDYVSSPTKGFDAKSNSFSISFTIWARVKKYKTKNDPTFKAKVLVIKPSYKHGEYIDFEVKFYQDSYLNVFYISSKESSILYPVIEGDKRFADKLYKVDEIKKFNYIKAKTELLSEYGRILIVITKESYPYIDSKKDENGLSTITEIESIMEWLGSIEPNNRDEYFYEFTISKG